MDNLRQALDMALAWLLLPATLFGAGGAAICAMRKGKCRRQVVLEGVGGILIANMAGPLITLHAPEQWHYTLYFLVGWGGLEGVGRLYEAAVSGLERRIQSKIGTPDQSAHDGPWDGIDRSGRGKDHRYGGGDDN